jgi:hypothetical protein
VSDQLDTEQSEQLDVLLEQYGLARRAATMHTAARPCVGLRLKGKSKRVPLGASRVGGLPDLPSDWTYPQDDAGRHLVFVCQISFTEVPPTPPLPTRGTLYCFVEDDDDATDVRHCILFDEGDPARLRRASLPRRADWCLDGCNRLKVPYAVEFVRAISLPSSQVRWTARHVKLEGEAHAKYGKLLRALSRGLDGQLLGYPQVRAYGGLPAGMALLLELESVGPMEWWDAGALQVLAPRRSLARRTFAKTQGQIYVG